MDNAETRRPLNDAVAEELRAILARRQLRQQKLAEMLGENEMWVSRRARGAQMMTLGDVEKIAGALGVTVLDLLPSEVKSGLNNRYARGPVVTGQRPPSGRPGRSGPPPGPGRTSRLRPLPALFAPAD